MIRYAITAGNHGPFRKRDRSAMPPCGCDPTPLNQETGADRTAWLPFPPSLSLPNQVRQLAHRGVDWIQLREKHLSAGDLAALARQILTILDEAVVDKTSECTGRRTRLLINARADVAAATGAHGVHLPAGPEGLSPAHVHRLYQSAGLPRPTVSVACHTLAEVRLAIADAADLILFSPIFGKSVDDRLVTPGVGLEALQAACTLAHHIPVLALGGITQANTPACLQAGAAGIAAIRLFQSG